MMLRFLLVENGLNVWNSLFYLGQKLSLHLEKKHFPTYESLSFLVIFDSCTVIFVINCSKYTLKLLKAFRPDVNKKFLMFERDIFTKWLDGCPLSMDFHSLHKCVCMYDVRIAYLE